MRLFAQARKSLVRVVLLAGMILGGTTANSEVKSLVVQPGTTNLVVASPVEYQVFQRRSLKEGVMQFSGRCGVKCDRLVVQVAGRTMKGKNFKSKWQSLALDAGGAGFTGSMKVPSGGWYVVTLRAMLNKTVVAEQVLEHVGMGEVFVGAGQSNSTNCGGLASRDPSDGRTETTSGMVTSFDGSTWRIANDPQRGTHDFSTWQLGSFWPAFGDAMAAKYKVPVGVAVTGHGGTAIAQWTKGGPLFNWTLQRMNQLGTNGFRAVLWHQGESDFKNTTKYYHDGLGGIIKDFRAAAGWEMPWFVAIASYIPKQGSSKTVTEAQKMLCQEKVAMEGPDTDVMVGDLRDNKGNGIHFSKKGLKVHGEAWANKVGAYLDKVLK